MIKKTLISLLLMPIAACTSVAPTENNATECYLSEKAYEALKVELDQAANMTSPVDGYYEPQRVKIDNFSAVRRVDEVIGFYGDWMHLWTFSLEKPCRIAANVLSKVNNGDLKTEKFDSLLLTWSSWKEPKVSTYLNFGDRPRSLFNPPNPYTLQDKEEQK